MIVDLKESKDPPMLTPACCSAWKDLRSTFSWYSFEDFPEYLAMPHINGWRVNFCPSCGSETRMAVWRTN